MYIKRNISDHILSGAQQVPVIAIIGPRQSGKSTLAKELFPSHTYVDMQDADAYDFATTDPKGFLYAYKNEHGIIIDEAQYAPHLFAQIKVYVDQHPQPGYFVLSGSQNFLLHEKISESLAGRVYLYTLLPFSIEELQQAEQLAPTAQEQMFKGFYPRVYQKNVKTADYYDNYIATYIERDIRTIRNIDNTLTFQKFIGLCALRVGTTLNLTDLATSCGISQNTAKNWLSLLETSFILFLLPPYYNNLGKRITKSPKLYFYDVGLAAALMNIDQEALIKKRDLYGALFENMIVVDMVKNIHNHGTRATMTFFRDSNQNEVDLIIESSGNTTAVEIKASQTISNSFFSTLVWFKSEVPECHTTAVVYGGQQNQTRSDNQRVVSWQNLTALL